MSVDPVTLEVIRNRLEAIADEMELTLLRTSHSAIVREALDASAALFDANGKQVAQAAAAPIHLGMLVPAVEALLERFPVPSMSDGDAVLPSFRVTNA
ncbi:MAG: hydantoinase B/oxoprolinase family protein, partial [Gaiellales bacterium]